MGTARAGGLPPLGFRNPEGGLYCSRSRRSLGGRGLQGGGGLEKGEEIVEGGEEAHRAGPRPAGEALVESGALVGITEGYQEGSGGRI